MDNLIIKAKKLILQFLTKRLEKKGQAIEDLVEKERVLALIESLHPIRTEKTIIRFGPVSDGGYLLPDDLDGVEACFSPGTGQIFGFEYDCFKRGIKVFMADGSVPAPKNTGFHHDFTNKHLGVMTNDFTLTLDDWVNQKIESENSDLLLQMDIEGGEYLTLLNISEALLQRFRIIVIEFHNLNHLWNRFFFDQANAVFERLLQHHHCVHIHPNNCDENFIRASVTIPICMEFTFLRKDRSQNISKNTSFPHPLDRDNDPGRPKIDLPKIWYSTTG